MNRKKIMHVANMVGGVEVCVRQIINNIDDLKIQSLVVSQNLKGKAEILSSNQNTVKCLEIPIQREIDLFKDIVCLFKLLLIIKQERPDIIHAHSAKAGLLCRAASILLNVKVFYTPHAFSFLSAKRSFFKKLYLNIERLLITKKILLVATSKSEKNLAIKEVGYEPQHTFLLNNSIKINTIPKSKSEFTKRFDEYICTVARPSFQKNLKMMINVFKIVSKKEKSLHLFIIGAGEYSPEKKTIQDQIIKLGLKDRITVLPWISRQEVQKILIHSRLYVSTSRYEGLPYAVLESMFLRTPLVLTNCYGNKDLIINNKTGFLVNLNDIYGMASKIIDLIHNKSKREKFVDSAYRLLNKNHNFREYLKKLTNLYLGYDEK